MVLFFMSYIGDIISYAQTKILHLPCIFLFLLYTFSLLINPASRFIKLTMSVASVLPLWVSGLGYTLSGCLLLAFDLWPFTHPTA